jgi:aspartyl-tRNA(Asn)/glutamyl-tRNA(Gln) amidotransferase subunit C
MITAETIKHLAELSRLEISEEEVSKLTGEVDSILGYVGQIAKTTGDMSREIPPLRNVMREDAPQNAPREFTKTVLAGAPNRLGDYLKVKKILGDSDDII